MEPEKVVWQAEHSLSDDSNFYRCQPTVVSSIRELIFVAASLQIHASMYRRIE